MASHKASRKPLTVYATSTTDVPKVIEENRRKKGVATATPFEDYNYSATTGALCANAIVVVK